MGKNRARSSERSSGIVNGKCPASNNSLGAPVLSEGPSAPSEKYCMSSSSLTETPLESALIWNTTTGLLQNALCGKEERNSAWQDEFMGRWLGSLGCFDD